jgi:hypothetical protein
MKLLLCGLFLISSSAFASRIITLKKEASDALYHISHCTAQVSEILVDGAWIGETKKWNNRNRNYGYTFNVFNTNWSDFSTYKVGEIRLKAQFIANPPADAPSYYFKCSLKKQ